MRKMALISFIVLILLINFVSGEFFSPETQRYIKTGQTQDWYYIEIHKVDGSEYIGIDKNDRGAIGIADDSEFYGRFWLVPAFQHPSNSDWYICPVRDMQTVNQITDLGSGWFFDSSDSGVVCYQYSDLSVTATVDMDVQFSFVTDTKTAKTKINVNVTVNGVSPSNTGFGFFFYPENPSKYRYAEIDGQTIDLQGVEGSVPVDKIIEVLDGKGNPIGHIFDWADMVDNGKRFSEIRTINNKKGLLVGTYDYGASNFISIDPIYVVDYSPKPAVHLIDGVLESDPESHFGYEIDITEGVSDNSSLTQYEVGNYFNIRRTLFYDNFEDGTLSPFTKVETDPPLSVTVSSDSPLNGSYSMLITGSNNPSSEIGYANVTIDTTNYTNLTLSYTRETVGSESTDYFSVGISYDAGNSWHTLESWYGNKLESRATFNLSSLYNNNSNIQLRFVFNGDHNTDEFRIDDVLITGFDVGRTTDNKAISGKWSKTYDPAFYWFLFFTKETDGSNMINIYAYNDSDKLSNQFVRKPIMGIGNFSVNVGSLLDYEQNTVNMTFSQLRLFFDTPTNISELWLRKEANDTTPPTISNCSINVSNIGCLESVSLQCNVTDEVGIDNVTFQINGVNYSAMLLVDEYIVVVDPTENGTTTYDFEKVYAYDLHGNSNQTDPNINFTYTCIFEDYINISHSGIEGTDQLNKTNSSVVITWTTSHPSDSTVSYGLSQYNLNETASCQQLVTTHQIPLTNLLPNTTYFYELTSSVNPTQTKGVFNFTTLPLDCVEDWVQDPITCQINDSYIKTYSDKNSCGTYTNLPSDNGTLESCNYCSEDIVQIKSGCVGGFQNVSYIDNNFSTCCAITNLTSDCSILFSPYNETSTVACSSNGTISCDINTFAEYGFFEDKIKWICYPHFNSTASCISYVKDLSGGIVQVNPDYKTKANTLITFSSGETEERTSFNVENGLVTLYFTKDNLVFDGRQYIFGVKCSDGSTTTVYETLLTPEYESVKTPVTRWFWFKENATRIILGLLLAVLLVWILGYFIRELRKK